MGAFMPYIFTIICTENHLRLVWRLCLGFGCIQPLSLLYLRIKLDEPEHYKRNSIKKHVPYGLVAKFYWRGLICISVIYFIYDVSFTKYPAIYFVPVLTKFYFLMLFVIYGFGIYATTILGIILPSGPLSHTFGRNTVINLFYIPGSALGAPVSDWLGPTWTTCLGLCAQSAMGFVMAGCYSKLATASNITAFTVVYGIFLSFGELGPVTISTLGDENLGHCHSWTILLYCCRFWKDRCLCEYLYLSIYPSRREDTN